MKVLVTGAFGYFGLALIRRLAREHEVLAVGRCARNPKAMPSDARITCRDTGRRADLGLRAPDADGCDAVVHLIGATPRNPPRPAEDGWERDGAGQALEDGPQWAYNMVRWSRQWMRNPRLILASSIAVYRPSSGLLREESPLGPDTLYGALKVVAEAVWQQRGGTALRFAHIYGAGCGVDLGRDGVTERLARAAAGGKPFELHGDGSQVIDLVHIDDACEAVALALTHEGPLPPAINVGGDNLCSVAALARAVLRRDIPRLPPGWSGSYRALDSALAGTTLGWRPRVEFSDGMSGLIDMMRGAPCA